MKTVKIQDINLVHRTTAQGNHRLEQHSPHNEPIIGEWTTAKGIAILGNFGATTEYFRGVLPEVFRITEVQARKVND